MYDWEMPMRAKENLETVLVSKVFFAHMHLRRRLRFLGRRCTLEIRPAFAACSAELLHLRRRREMMRFQAGDVRLGDAHAGKKKTLKPYWFQGFLLPT